MLKVIVPNIRIKVKRKYSNIFLIEAYIRLDSLLEVCEANMNAIREVFNQFEPSDTMISMILTIRMQSI